MDSVYVCILYISTVQSWLLYIYRTTGYSEIQQNMLIDE